MGISEFDKKHKTKSNIKLELALRVISDELYIPIQKQNHYGKMIKIGRNTAYKILAQNGYSYNGKECEWNNGNKRPPKIYHFTGVQVHLIAKFSNSTVLCELLHSQKRLDYRVTDLRCDLGLNYIISQVENLRFVNDQDFN